jgi:hypothetical protein
MNSTSRAILQTLVTTDSSLSSLERSFVQRLISGQIEATPAGSMGDEKLLVTQKRAAELLSVNRITIWRMTKDCLLHPVEILPGTWRYPFNEIVRLAQQGAGTGVGPPRERIPVGIASAA